MENARLYRAVQEADRRKNEFLAMLAHELRNPLAPIRNAVHIMQGENVAPARMNWARDVIGRHAWPEAGAEIGSNTIDVHMANLRRKLAGAGIQLLTVRGSGYRLVEA